MSEPRRKPTEAQLRAVRYVAQHEPCWPEHGPPSLFGAGRVSIEPYYRCVKYGWLVLDADGAKFSLTEAGRALLAKKEQR